MNRSPLVRRTPLARGGQLARVSFSRAPGVFPDPPGNPRASQGISGRRKSARKTASDAAIRAAMPALRDRAGGCCEITGDHLVDGFGHAHHRLKRGGPDRDTLANLVFLSPTAHAWAHAEPALAHRFGWILRSWQDPAGTPIYRAGRWVLLDDTGGIHPK